MFKKRLFTPGPTPVPETVMLRMSEPMIHHRNPEFGEIFKRVNQNLQYLFQTTQPVLTLTCSGTGGVEATFVSMFSQGDTIISVNGGKFGERWVNIPRVFGLNVIEIKNEWGKAPTVQEITSALGKAPNAKAVYLTHSETSTGTATDVKTLAKVIRDHSSALVCIDGITSIGAHEFYFDDWGIDACVTGSQKGLMIPPGLAFVALSQRAISAMKDSQLPKFYFDLRKALKSYNENTTPWTPAITLITGLDHALQMIRTETMENIWRRHKLLAMAVRRGVHALGLKLFSDSPSYAVTPVWVPEGIEWKLFNKTLKSAYGITIAGGQGEFAERIFRISHLGYYDHLDVLTVIGALEHTLHDCGWKFESGAGVKAVQETYHNQTDS
jgi:serine---pyruvate transaminase